MARSGMASIIWRLASAVMAAFSPPPLSPMAPPKRCSTACITGAVRSSCSRSPIGVFSSTVKGRRRSVTNCSGSRVGMLRLECPTSTV